MNALAARLAVARGWWPEGAPCQARRLGELTSRELAALTRFAEGAERQGAGGDRLAAFLGELIAEAAERAELLAAFTERAKTGKLGPL